MSPKTAAHLIAVEEPAETPFYIAATQQAAARPSRVSNTATPSSCSTAAATSRRRRGGSAGLFHLDTRYLSRLELLVNDTHPLLLGSNLRDDNSRLLGRPDQSRPHVRPAHRAGEGHRAHLAHHVPVARHRLSAAWRAQLRRPRGRLADLDPVRERFCRPVRGARRAPRTPRHGGGQSARRRPGAAELSRPRRQGPAHDADLRSAAEPADHQRRGLRAASRTRRDAAVVPGGELRRRRHAAAAVPARLHCGAPRTARGDPAADLGRDIQRAFQRNAVPLGRRSRHADDRHAARPLPLCRHPLVLDDVRPRRPDHRAADAVVEPGRGARRAAPARGLSGHDRRSAGRCRSPEKSCTRCAAAKWRRCAKCRSGFTTAASIRRRCSCCSPASMSSAPAIWKPSPSCGRRSRRRSAGSTARAIRTATASSNTSAPTSKASPIRAGRIRTTRSSTPTAGWRKARSRSPRCRAMSMPPSAWRRGARGGSGSYATARQLDAEASRLAARFEAAFWCPEIETYALALDGAKKPCRVRTSNAGQVLFTGIAASERAARVAKRSVAAALLLRLGHPHRGARRSPLQSDVLSQRLDLAARQCADRAWAWRATDTSRRSQTLFEGLFDAAHLHGLPPAAGTVLRLPAPARPRADALSGRLLAAGLGQRHAVHAARSLARPANSIRSRARSGCAIRACRRFWTR